MNQESEAEFDPFANEKKERSPGAAIAWLALFLVLVVTVFTGWQWWQGQSTDVDGQTREAAIRQLTNDLSQQAQVISGLESRALELEKQSGGVAELQLELAKLQNQITEVRGDAGSGLRQYEVARDTLVELEERATALESGLAALAVRGESPEKRIELAQVDFLLRTANERLQLFGDLRSADQALVLADGQLEALDDPLYLPVRRSIATARLALESTPQTDIIGLTASISSLQADIGELPFKGQEIVTTTEEASEPDPDAGMWERFKSAMAGLVTVRRRVPDEAIVSLQDKDYVRQGLWLQMESARLALMRADATTYHRSLERAVATLDQYFEPADARVQRAEQMLSELDSTDLQQAFPDISEPWATLNLLRKGSADPQTTEPVPELPAIDVDDSEPEPTDAITGEHG